MRLEYNDVSFDDACPTCVGLSLRLRNRYDCVIGVLFNSSAYARPPFAYTTVDSILDITQYYLGCYPIIPWILDIIVPWILLIMVSWILDNATLDIR